MNANSDRPVTGEQDIELATLGRAVARGLGPLLIASVVAGAATWGVLSTMAPRYTSESQLQIVAKRSNPFPEGRDRSSAADSAAPRLDREAVNTHARALLAPSLLLRVADELKLKNRAEFDNALGPIDTFGRLARLVGIGGPRGGTSVDDRVLETIRHQLQVAAVKDSRIIPIRFTSADPQLAAKFANTLADTYRAGLVAAPVEETSAVVKVLAPKVEQLKDEVKRAEAAVQRFRAKTGQFRSGPQLTPVNDQRMAALNGELIKVETARAEAEARWRTASELHRSGSAEILPDVQKSPLIQGLIGQRVRLERQVAEASASLLPAHPRMRQLNADVAGLRRQIAAEVGKVVQSLQKDWRAATLKVEAANRQIDKLALKVVNQGGDEAELRSLVSTANAKRSELERLQKLLEDNRTVVNTRQVPVEAQVIRARASGIATFPKTIPMALLAMAAVLILGLAFIITRALLASPVHSSAASRPRPAAKQNITADGEREHTPGASLDHKHDANHDAVIDPPLAYSVAGKPTPAIAAVARQPLAILPEPVDELATRLLTRTDVASGVRTLVTAAGPGLSVLREAKALAEALSRQDRRVVLIVWSLAGHGLTIPRSTQRRAGINDLLAGNATFEQVIGRLPGSTVQVIQPGSAVSDRAVVLDQDRLNLMLDALDEVYDQIVVAGAYDDAIGLFEALEGRFEAAVVVSTGAVDHIGQPAAGTLLGFEVTDIDIVTWPKSDNLPDADSDTATLAGRVLGSGQKS